MLRWHQQATWIQPTTLDHQGCTPPTLGLPQAPSYTIQILPLLPGSP